MTGNAAAATDELRVAQAERASRLTGSANSKPARIASGELPDAVPAATGVPPVGFVDAVSASVAYGWCGDPNQSPVNVRVTVDGAALGTVSANLSRPDVAAATSFGPNTGWQISIPAWYGDGAQHTLRAFGLDNDGSSVELSGSPRVFSMGSASNTPPQGFIDGISATGLVYGWCGDGEQAPLSVRIAIDGATVATVPTGSSRTDVGAVHPAFGAGTGWQFQIPAGYLNGAQHTLRAFGLDNDATPVELSQSPRGFALSAGANTAPLGYFDNISAAGVATGWCADREQTAVAVRIQIDGATAGTVATGIARPDVQAALPQFGGTTGWQFQIPATYNNGASHSVRVYGLDNDGTPVELTQSPRSFIFGTAPQPGNTPPQGFLDDITSAGVVRGWCGDREQASVAVRVVVDGATLGTVTTSLARPDVAAAIPAFGSNTGWQYSLPASFVDGIQHSLRVFGLDNDGTPVELAQSPRLFILGTPVTPPTPAALLTLYDGPTGVSSQQWNSGANLWWRNSGGDWLDIQGRPQGPAAYAVLPASGNATDVTSLVNAWLTFGNTGALLFPSSDGAFGGRGHSAPPTLTVNSSRGVIACPCNAANVISPSSENPLAIGSDNVLRSGVGMPIALQFDLGALSGATVNSAVMALTRVAFSPTTLHAFMLNPPTVIADFPIIGGGLSASYIGQPPTAIATHPAVVVAADWQPDMSVALPEGQMTGDTTFGVDSTAGRIATFRFGPGQYEPIARMRRHSSLGLAQLTEAFVGFWMRFEDDGTTLQGTKIGMGISGRGGAPTLDGGRLYPLCGNGGSPTDGYYHPAAPGNPQQGSAYTCGWSMRPWLAARTWDSNNPLAPYRSLQTYAYWAQMPSAQSPYGQNFIWGGVALSKNRWYWIEQYVKINTVSNADGNGNGVGNRDGEYRVWINGHPIEVLDYISHQPTLNWCFTNNAAIALDELPWVDFYEGGALDPNVNSRVSLGAFVVARSYIGPPQLAAGGNTNPIPPVSSNRPAWLAGKPTNTWLQIPNTQLWQCTLQPAIEKGYTVGVQDDIGYGRPNFGIMAYSGGTMIREQSMFAITGGGGSGAWAGNDWRVLTLEDDAPAWRYLTQPSHVSTVPARNSGRIETNSDGTPCAFHSYWSPHYHSGTGRLLRVTQSNDWASDSLRVNDVWICNPTTGAWTQGPTLPDPRAWDGPWSCMDFATGRIYVGMTSAIDYYDPSTNTVGRFWAEPNEISAVDRGAAAVGNGKLLRLGRFGGDTAVTTLFVDLATGFVAYGRLSGVDSAAINDGYIWQNGGSIEFDEGLQKWVAFPDDGYLYLLTHVSDIEFRVDRMVIAGVAPTPGVSSAKHGGGPRGRVRYVPRLGGIVIAQNADSNVYFVATST